MKKTYVKPQVFFEDFQLSASIAAGCEYTTNHTMNMCAYEITGGRSVFIDETTSCLDVKVQNGQYGNVCYHVPADTSNLFTSA